MPFLAALDSYWMWNIHHKSHVGCGGLSYPVEWQKYMHISGNEADSSIAFSEVNTWIEIDTILNMLAINKHIRTYIYACACVYIHKNTYL